MVFPTIGQYALRVMSVAAELSSGERVRSQDLATQTHVPPAYLSKVCRRLVSAGLLNSKKGHHGGFCLALPAASITFEAILQAVDAMPDTNACAYGWGDCDAEQPCPLHSHWTQLSGSIVQWARMTTLADVDSETPH